MYLVINNTKSRSLLFILVIAFAGGCKKKVYDEGQPKVKMDYVKMIGSDTAEVAGKVLSSGTDVVQYTGFCFGNDHLPAITENQVLLNGTDGEFTIRLPVKHDTVYYFRAFAANSFGYTLSTSTPLNVPHPAATVVPCKLADNVLTDNGNAFNMIYIYKGSSYAGSAGSYGIQANDASGTESITISFNITPINGVYTTQSDASQFTDNNSPKEVYIDINGFVANTGNTVYVTENPDHTFSVSFCKLDYTAFSTNFTASGKITAK